MANSSGLTLKAFWEAVEARLAACSAEELRTILRAMAQATRPNLRSEFLSQLNATAVAAPVMAADALLDEIHDIHQGLAEAMANPPEPEYERSYWDEEEDTSEPYVDFVEPLVVLFDQAQAAFDCGNSELARAAYQELLTMLSAEDDYGRGIRLTDLPDVSPKETVARYLRALYETTPAPDRPARLDVQMRQPFLWPPHDPIMLDDLMQITTRPLPDRWQFLEDWIGYLRTLDSPSGGTVDSWLREAVRMISGTAGLEALARTEGVTRPRAYLDWFTALEEEGRTSEVLAVSQEALTALPPDMPIRAVIADHLCAAAARLDRKNLVCAARWEAFSAKPTVVRLLDLRDAAADDSDRATLMQQALARMLDQSEHPPLHPEFSLFREGGDTLEWPVSVGKADLAHAYLLAGEWEMARTLADEGSVLGWSSDQNYQGLVVGAFLVLLAGVPASDLPPNLAQVWPSVLGHTMSYYAQAGAPGEGIVGRLEKHYAVAFLRANLTRDQQATELAWCVNVVRQRVEAIVGNQHRGSYDKAAVLTVACAETLRLHGDSTAARSFVDEVCARFPRHSAFQRELRSALASGRGFGLSMG